jgi:hypothetical protein
MYEKCLKSILREDRTMIGLLKVLPVAAFAAVLGFSAIPNQAQAHGGWGGWHGGGWGGGWRGGWGVTIGIPYAYPYYYPYPYAYPSYYYAPPVYTAPPSYYAPPASSVPPSADPASSQSPPGYTCYAGPYVCPLQVVNPINGPCTCPTNSGDRANGSVR